MPEDIPEYTEDCDKGELELKYELGTPVAIPSKLTNDWIILLPENMNYKECRDDYRLHRYQQPVLYKKEEIKIMKLMDNPSQKKFVHETKKALGDSEINKL